MRALVRLLATGTGHFPGILESHAISSDSQMLRTAEYRVSNTPRALSS